MDEELESRALCAEDELSALRLSLREYQRWLSDLAHGGPVIYRREVVERLSSILEQ